MWKDQQLPSSHVTWWQWKSPCSTGSTSTTSGCYYLWIRLAKVVVWISLMFQVGLSSFWFKIPLQVCCAYLLTSNMCSHWNLVHEEIHRKCVKLDGLFWHVLANTLWGHKMVSSALKRSNCGLSVYIYIYTYTVYRFPFYAKETNKETTTRYPLICSVNHLGLYRLVYFEP